MHQSLSIPGARAPLSQLKVLNVNVFQANHTVLLVNVHALPTLLNVFGNKSIHFSIRLRDIPNAQDEYLEGTLCEVTSLLSTHLSLPLSELCVPYDVSSKMSLRVFLMLSPKRRLHILGSRVFEDWP